MFEIVKCSVCGEKFDIESCGTDIDELNFCDYCRGEYTFRCSVCEGEELEECRGDIGSVLIVNDEKEAGISKGIYEIVDYPYFYGSMFGHEGFFESALKWLGDLPPGGIDTGGYACGHVCRYCNPVVKRRAILFKKF